MPAWNYRVWGLLMQTPPTFLGAILEGVPSGLLLTLINITAPELLPDGPLVSAGRSAGPCCRGELTRAHNTPAPGAGVGSLVAQGYPAG